MITPQEHIASIRGRLTSKREAGEDGHDLEDIARESVKLLADELNSLENHFIWEILQNADDNTYALDKKPTVEFRLTSTYLHISCNELGFTPKNVESLCVIGRSTKKEQKADSIGEKGIGWKSVFRVANKVHVSSNGYNFVFDREFDDLGMLRPLWADFPLTVDTEKTHFLLMLKEDCQSLAGDLRTFSPTSILFLRKISRLEITIETIGSKVTRSFDRADPSIGPVPVVSITSQDQQRSETIDYTWMTIKVTDMPPDKKRAGLINSEVAIAFPYYQGQPVQQPQSIFAFLPIRPTDFRFLMHADFVLTANREDLATKNAWNERLKESLVTCFVQAINAFNKSNRANLRYGWLRFLENVETGRATPFGALGVDILQALSRSSVLETSRSSISKPEDTFLVPRNFRGRNGKFILYEYSTHHYMTHSYDKYLPSEQVLSNLKISKVTEDHFLTICSDAAKSKAFQSRKGDWHATLANILLSCSDMRRIAEIPLIPLQDGRWVASAQGPCFLPSANFPKGHKIFHGLTNLHVVDEAALTEPLRKELFAHLRIQELRSIDIYRSIVYLHSQTQPPEMMTEVNLVQRVRFLFLQDMRTQYRGQSITPVKQFWLLNSVKRSSPAQALYQDFQLASGYRLSSTFSGSAWASYFVLPSILQLGRKLPDFEEPAYLSWLSTTLGVKDYLTLSRDGASFTPEFDHVLRTQPPRDIVEILVDSMRHQDKSLRTKMLHEKIASITMTLSEATKVRLSDCFLPTRKVQAVHVGGLPLLSVKEPDHEKWLILESVGVTIKPDLKFYMVALKNAQGTTVRVGKVAEIYHGLDLFFPTNADSIRTYFNNNNAIYYPPERAWLSKHLCVWEQTPGISNERALKPFYRGLQGFFYDKLHLRTASVQSVVDELVRMAPPSDCHPDRRKGLLMGLSEYLSRTPDHASKLDVLREKGVIPMAGGDLESLGSNKWVLGDRHDYKKALQGTKTIRFSAFTVSECLDLQPLSRAVLSHFGTEHLLSRMVDEEQSLGDKTQLDIASTDIIRGKVRFVRSILRDPRAGVVGSLDMTFKQLEGIEVYCAPGLITSVSLKRDDIGQAVRGRPLQGPQVLYKARPEGIRFFINENSLSHDVREVMSAKFASHLSIINDGMRRLLDLVFSKDDADAVTDRLTKEHVSVRQDQNYQIELLGEPVNEPQPTISGELYQDDSSAASPTAETLSTASTQPTPLTDAGDFEQAPSTKSFIGTLPLPTVTTSPEKVPAPEIQDVKELPAKKEKQLGKNSRKGKYMRLDLAGITNMTGNRSSPSEASNGSSDPSMNDPNASGPRVSPQKSTAPASHSASAVRQRFGLRPLQSSSASGPRFYSKIKSAAQAEAELRTGLAGEKFTYSLLQALLDKDAPLSAWTSELRVDAGHPAWTPAKRDATYADFTLTPSHASQRLLSEWLKTYDVDFPIPPAKSRTVHIEVKATAVDSEIEPFHLSDNQMHMAKRVMLEKDESNVFLIFRWYNVDPEDEGASGAQLQVYGNPWEERECGELRMRASQWVLWKKGASEGEDTESHDESNENEDDKTSEVDYDTAESD